MRIATLNTDYPRFLSWLYQNNPELVNAGYAEQMHARNASLFGVADFYSRAFKALGHEAVEIHANNGPMQAAWAREQGLIRLAEELSIPTSRPRLTMVRKMLAPFRSYLKPLAHRLRLDMHLTQPQRAVLRHQLEAFRPDVIFNQDAFYIDCAFLKTINAARGPVLACYLGKPAIGYEIAGYDLVVALLPSVAEFATRRGARAAQSSLAFDTSVLGVVDTGSPKDIDISFVGSVSEEHFGRIKMLEAVAQRFNLQFFGSGIEHLPNSSPLRRCWRGELWGREMYDALTRSKITLNSHVDAVGDEAGNMRLYEATGVKTFLLTDGRAKLHELFEPNRHLMTWRTPTECVDRIAYFLARDGEREAMARAGQQHTLSHHTFAHRARQLSKHFAEIA